MTNLLTPIDPLGEALHVLRMSGIFYASSELSAPWGFAVPAMANCLMFHVIVEGRCWLNVTGADEPRLLQQGELVLVPHGAGHALMSDVDADQRPLFDLPREFVGDRYEVIRYGGGGDPARLICGFVQFDHPAAARLIRMLPPIVCIEPSTAPEHEWIGSTLRFMASEARELRPGGEAVITRLADILVIQVIRAWIAGEGATGRGWLAALQDKQIGRALAAIHRDPARAWTVAMLADEVAMSRSAFAARFTDLVGETPMHYVTYWRMNVAVGWIKDEGLSLGEMAQRLGYQSEAAFHRAFKRMVGLPPGAFRRSGGVATAS